MSMGAGGTGMGVEGGGMSSSLVPGDDAGGSVSWFEWVYGNKPAEVVSSVGGFFGRLFSGGAEVVRAGGEAVGMVGSGVAEGARGFGDGAFWASTGGTFLVLAIGAVILVLFLVL